LRGGDLEVAAVVTDDRSRAPDVKPASTARTGQSGGRLKNAAVL